MANELGDAVTITQRDHGWLLEPSHPRASPLDVFGDGPDFWRLTLAFGRGGGRIEMRYMDAPAPRLALEEANHIIHSIVAGRLTERRKGQRSSRWVLTLSTGKVLRGAANWRLPWAMPWEQVEAEQFAPWTSPDQRLELERLQ